jgi:integrase
MQRIRQRPLLFYTVLILYCCFLRPKEIRSLKFKQFDLKRGLIYLSYKHAKDNDNRIVTIPSAFLPYFDVEFFAKHPAESYVFGADFKPGKASSCGHNIMYRQHLAVLEELKREGKLRDIEGLTLYSWKDTGITEALEYLPLLSVQDQAGHSKPEMTMKYRHKGEVNDAFRGFENKILPK